MANEDIKEILKSGSKAKLIQLAVEFREFTVDNLTQPTFTQEEIQAVKDKAKKEGWDGELFRATYKARDIEAMTLELRGQIYEALYYLHELLKEIQRVEIMLDILREDYIGDYNEKTDKYDNIVNKTRKEMEKDIDRVKLLVVNTLEDITEAKTLIEHGNEMIEKGEEEYKELGRKLTRGDLFNILFRNYKSMYCNVKIGFYLLVKSEFGGYRLYRKEQFKQVEKAFVIKNLLLVGNITLSLEHLDYLLEVIGENKPELLEIIKEDTDMYIPDKKWIKEVTDYIDTYVRQPIGEGKFKKGDKKLYYKAEYLLNELNEEEIKEVEKGNKVLEDYVRYGK